MKTILFFTQASCAPCKAIEPTITGMSDHYGAKLQKIQVDTEGGLATAQRAGEIATPVVIVLDTNGVELKRLRGKMEILNGLENLLKPSNTEGGKKSNLKKVAAIGAAFFILSKIFK